MYLYFLSPGYTRNFLQNYPWRCVLAFSHKGLLSARRDKLECTTKAECENAYETMQGMIKSDSGVFEYAIWSLMLCLNSINKKSKYIDKEFIFDVMIASDIIDSLYKILGISQTKQRISQTSQLISQNRKDRKRRHTNNPFKLLFIALFLTKYRNRKICVNRFRNIARDLV